jgi:hypothetical protein
MVTIELRVVTASELVTSRREAERLLMGCEVSGARGSRVESLYRRRAGTDGGDLLRIHHLLSPVNGSISIPFRPQTRQTLLSINIHTVESNEPVALRTGMLADVDPSAVMEIMGCRGDRSGFAFIAN